MNCDPELDKIFLAFTFIINPLNQNEKAI